MKLKITLLAAAALALSVSLPLQAQTSKAKLGPEKDFTEFVDIHVKNFQDESLGRIKELGIDLINGRIVEVLIISDGSLNVGTKIVAVPPLALVPDLLNQVYRLNVSTETFKEAPAVKLSRWTDTGHSAEIAATYRLFGKDPYFLEEGAMASKTDSRPKVAIGYVERCTKIVGLPVGNFQGQSFGKVWTMTLDIPRGRILNVIVLAPGNFKTKSIIPATALSFNAARNALLLDDSKMEYADEPHFVFTEAAFGQDDYFREEASKGQHSNDALQQGNSYLDVDRTVRINKDIRAAKVNGRNVQIGTINGRVTLRGWVHTEEDKRRIGEIAIAASSLEIVDNQITVGKPAKK